MRTFLAILTAFLCGCQREIPKDKPTKNVKRNHEYSRLADEQYKLSIAAFDAGLNAKELAHLKLAVDFLEKQLLLDQQSGFVSFGSALWRSVANRCRELHDTETALRYER